MGAEKETEHFFLEQRRLIRVCTCRHSRKNILSDLNCFQRLSAVDTCTFDCGHKLGAKKEKYNVDFLLDTMALKYNYIFLSNSEGSFKTAQCQLVALP